MEKMIETCPLKHYAARFVMETALGAANIINEIYATNFETEYKPGDEPVTIADKQSDTFYHIIGYLISKRKCTFSNCPSNWECQTKKYS